MNTQANTQTVTLAKSGLSLLIPVCLTVIVAAAFYVFNIMQTYLANMDAYADHDVMVRLQSNVGMAIVAATIGALTIMTVVSGSIKRT